MTPRLPPRARAALAALSRATSTGRDLEIVTADCPLCDTPLQQSISGTRRPLRHFNCPSCGWWLTVSAASLREVVLRSADPDDECDTIGAQNGEIWYNTETGKYVLFPTEWDRRAARATARGRSE